MGYTWDDLAQAKDAEQLERDNYRANAQAMSATWPAGYWDGLQARIDEATAHRLTVTLYVATDPVAIRRENLCTCERCEAERPGDIIEDGRWLRRNMIEENR